MSDEIKTEEKVLESSDTQKINSEDSRKTKKAEKKSLKSIISDHIEKLQLSRFNLLFTVIFACVIMFGAAFITFFVTVRDPEQVMVPNVVGKEITSALLEMQVKELYPKIQLRYSDSPDDAGKILAQSPDAGAIVKAGRRITLTVSRGVIIDHVENYIGQLYDDVKINLQTMFTGSSVPLIVLAEPSYKADKSDAGTILAQDPPEGTNISNPVTVKLVVSRGPEYENTRVPKLVGLNIQKLLQTLSTSKVVFDFESHIVADGEVPGTVTSQSKSNSDYVKNYSRVSADFAIPAVAAENETYGVYKTQLTEYPYPVQMSLEYIDAEGTRVNLVNFMHTGGIVTMPYAVPHGAELVLSVAGKVVARNFVD